MISIEQLRVKQLVNPDFDSNSFILEPYDSALCWVIDFGFLSSTDQLQSIFTKPVGGIFLTHCHYDHICGLGKLIKLFPDCMIFGSSYTLAGLADSKLNLSYYKGGAVEFQLARQKSITDGDKISISNQSEVEVISTPGHNAGSLSYLIDQYLFTGDSLIPGHKLVTKLKSGNKKDGQESVQKLTALISRDTIICAGHGEQVAGATFLDLT